MRVLVTGSSGFIGGAALNRFHAAGWDTLGVGRRPYSEIHQPHPAPYLQQNLDSDKEYLPSKHFDVVVHSAAKSAPWGRWKDFYAANVKATQLLMNYCEQHGQPRLIYISSPTIFAKFGHQLAVTETSRIPRKPISNYARSKILAENCVRKYSGEWVILRPRAVFGPYDSALFPRLIRAIKLKRFPKIKHTGPPVFTDLTYIDNVVDVIFAAATLPAAARQDFNITNNEPVILQETIEQLAKRISLPITEKIISYRKAAFAAHLLEWSYKLIGATAETPITRYTFDAVANSKTFDVSKMIYVFGQPKLSIDEGINYFVDYWNNIADKSILED